MIQQGAAKKDLIRPSQLNVTCLPNTSDKAVYPEHEMLAWCRLGLHQAMNSWESNLTRQTLPDRAAHLPFPNSMLNGLLGSFEKN